VGVAVRFHRLVCATRAIWVSGLLRFERGDHRLPDLVRHLVRTLRSGLGVAGTAE